LADAKFNVTATVAKRNAANVRRDRQTAGCDLRHVSPTYGGYLVRFRGNNQ
jgi:hypothetical protein